jgi:acetyl-CoA carboxylase biotin carboxyl carrier protein
VLTFEQIKELVELVARRGLGGLELERSGFRLKIDGVREEAAPPAAATAAPAAPSAPAAAPSPPAAVPAPATGIAEETAGEAPAEGDHVIESPIVGTFYRAPSPDADPFVEVGGRVRKGQVLCIIEAMKIMNEIDADADGVVTRVFPKSGQAVEFGEPLFVLDTSV